MLSSTLEELLFWKQEKERWIDACESGFSEALKELYKAKFSPDDFLRKERKLRTVRVVLFEAINFAARIAPTLFEDLRGRPRWNRYLAALNYTFPRFQSGFVTRTVLSLLKLKGASERIESYTVRLGESLKVFLKMFQSADEYVKNWKHGEEIAHSFQKKPQENLTRLYANYRTFHEDAKFESFHQTLENTSKETTTVIIEDVVSLWLMIAEDFVEIIVRLPLLEKIEEFQDENDDRKLVETDLAELLKRLTRYVKDSEHRQLIHLLLRKVADQAITSWYEEECELRRQHPSMEMKRRFVEQFEQGLIL